MKQKIMAGSAPYSSIFRLGIPLLVGQIGVIMTGFMDTLMVGRYSTDALASASFVNSLFTFMVILCLGFSYGLTPIVGVLYAQGKKAKAGGALKNAMAVNALFSLAVGLAMLALYFFLDRLEQPAQLLPLMRPYYVVVLLSMIPLIVVNTLRQFTDGITDTHVSMWVLTGGNLLNIVGNWMLIYGTCGMPEWGLFGAGVSTLLSRVVMAVVYIAVFCRMKKYKGYFRGFIEESVNRRDMLAVCRTSSPVAMQMGMETGIFTVASVMIGWLGAEYLASYQVILILGTIGFMVYYSFGAGMAIKISNCAGVGDVRQIRLSARAGYHIILLSALVACLVFFFAGRYIIMLFTSDARVIAISTTLIIPLLLYQLGDATQVAYANALRGISCVMPVMKYAFIAYVLVGLPLNYLFGFTFHGGIVGIYLSFFVALLLAGILYMQRFYRQLRQM